MEKLKWELVTYEGNGTAGYISRFASPATMHSRSAGMKWQPGRHRMPGTVGCSGSVFLSRLKSAKKQQGGYGFVIPGFIEKIVYADALSFPLNIPASVGRQSRAMFIDMLFRLAREYHLAERSRSPDPVPFFGNIHQLMPLDLKKCECAAMRDMYGCGFLRYAVPYGCVENLVEELPGILVPVTDTHKRIRLPVVIP